MRILLTKEEKRERARKRWLRWANENREHLRKVRRAWKKNNPDKVAAGHRRYAAAHPEKIKEKWQRHQSRYPEKCAQRTAKYNKKNPDKVKAKLRAYFQTPVGKRARVNGERRRRARIMGAEPVATAKEISSLLSTAVTCYYCHSSFDNDRRPTLDHVIPLAKGGAHILENLVAACSDCNSRKGTSLPHEFALRTNVSCIGIGNFT